MTRAMKDSGIEWIGKIPEDWNLMRLQFCLNEIKEKNLPVKSEQVLSLVKDKGVMPYEEKGNVGNVAKEDISEYKLAYPNTLILNSMNILIGSVGISKYFGCVSPVYYVFKETEMSDLRFINYICTTNEFQKELRRYAKGILEIRLRVSAQDIFKRIIAYPNKQEQIKIADFLDEKCSHIDSILEKTKASIDECKQLKQSVITQAVTKGIRPNRPMKDSGIEWIGQIPEDWEVIRIKWLLSERKEYSINGDEEPLSMSQKFGLIPTRDMDSIPNMASSFVGAKLAYIDDLVFNKLKAHLGVFSTSKYNGLVSPDYAVYITNNKTNSGFLEKLFKTPNYISQFIKRSTGVGAGLTRLYTSDLFDIKCAIPNTEEQEEIMSYINGKCSEIDTLITKKEKLIEELETYKKSLIYEYVTGKKEVI